MRVAVEPELWRWSLERSGRPVENLVGRFPRLPAWQAGAAEPTLKQLEDFARATRTPIGYFFLPAPPVERLPIPDFRRVAGDHPPRPSPDLLETLYLCQERQEWYRDFARATREPQRDFVGSLTVEADIVATATSLRARLGMTLDERSRCKTWEDALRLLIAQAETAGVLVMTSGIVGSNTHRVLDPEEFRGFALADDLAPLVFVNGADTKSAQMFTLAHELVHLWLGQSALSDATISPEPRHQVERFCNEVAAEFLVSMDLFRREARLETRAGAALATELQRLARIFKVSTLVILRRFHDAGGLTREAFWLCYREELDRLREIVRARKKGGGDYYRTLPTRVSHRLTRALVESTLEGRTSFTEAFRLLGMRKLESPLLSATTVRP